MKNSYELDVMGTLEHRKAELLSLGCRIYPNIQTVEVLAGDEVEGGEWIGNDGHALSLFQLGRLDERGYKQLKKEFVGGFSENPSMETERPEVEWIRRKKFRLMCPWSYSEISRKWYGEHYDHNLSVELLKDTSTWRWRVVSKRSKAGSGFEAFGDEATEKKAMNAAVRKLREHIEKNS